jgi:predicted DCC family thiol-disulfide oxidoreductase YuxK
MSADSPGQPEAVVLFDGVCNLCNSAVRFIIARDPAARFRFAPVESEAAARLLGAPAADRGLPDSIILLDRGRLYTRSRAALRICRRLRFPWPLLYGFIVVPPPMRNWLYDLVARNRYRWFGKRDACMVPTPETRARFLT